jgi:hypothetical protein
MQDAVDVQENCRHGHRVYSLGDRLPVLTVQRAGRSACAEELDACRGAIRRRGLVGADRFRAEARLDELATDRIVEQLREAVKVRRRRKPTKPTVASQERRLDEKKRRGQTKRLRRSTDD